MEHPFILNHFAEQQLKYDENIVITPELLQNIEIKFSLVLKYKDDVNHVGVQVDVVYLHESKQLLTYSVLLTIFDPEWQKFLKQTPNEEAIRDYALPWFDFAFGFIRGALAARAKDTKMADLFLPIFNSESCKQFILIDKIPSDKSE